MSTAPARSLDETARLAARGDPSAFERFYRATSARVATLARRLLGRERAEEGLQEVYLKAWRALPSWRGEAAAVTWLEVLARNTLIHLLARRVPPVRSDERELARQCAPWPEDGLRLDLESAMDALPDGARAVFVLHDLERLTHAEIGARLGITTGTSKSQLHRARMLLRAALQGESPGDEE